MRRTIIPGATLLAGLCATSLIASPPASEWEIGPVIRGEVYSRGMPASPTPARTGWSFDFPYASAAAGHVHYVTFDPGSLSGKSSLVVRYRVDAPRTVRFVPRENPGDTATVSLVLQRGGDNWSARGRYEFYRWYAPPASVQPLGVGVHEMTVSLGDPAWVSVLGRPASANPRAFREALADTGRLGLVFGSAGARGHGVFATGPARFTLLSFDVI